MRETLAMPSCQRVSTNSDNLCLAGVLVGQHVISQNICNDMMEIIRSKVLKFIVTLCAYSFFSCCSFCLFPFLATRASMQM